MQSDDMIIVWMNTLLHIAAWDILSPGQIENVVSEPPHNIEELQARGMAEDVSHKYGDRILKYIRNYLTRKDLRNYHRGGLFTILTDCTSDIDISPTKAG